jgi:putative phage-type endonuclease
VSLTAKQLEQRKGGITATDIVALAGLSPFRTAHDVFLDKCGTAPAWEGNEATSLGNELEPIVLRRLAEKRGLFVLPREPVTLAHPKHARHLATPDAWLSKTRLHDAEALGEAKVVGLRMAEDWGDDGEPDGPPDAVIAQVTWQMHVTGMRLTYIGALLGTEVRTYAVPLDDDLEGALVDTADAFLTDHVDPRKPPAIDGSPSSARMLKGLFPRARAVTTVADEQTNALAAQYLAQAARAKQEGAELEKLKQLLMAACGDAEALSGRGWRLFYKQREATTVAAYERAAYRHFDMREIKPR